MGTFKSNRHRSTYKIKKDILWIIHELRSIRLHCGSGYARFIPMRKVNHTAHRWYLPRGDDRLINYINSLEDRVRFLLKLRRLVMDRPHYFNRYVLDGMYDE